MSIWRRFAMNWHLQAMCSWACNFTKVLYLISRKTCTNRRFQHAQQFANLSVAWTFFTVMFLFAVMWNICWRDSETIYRSCIVGVYRGQQSFWLWESLRMISRW
jgi:hypothetical protein